MKKFLAIFSPTKGAPVHADEPAQESVPESSEEGNLDIDEELVRFDEKIHNPYRKKKLHPQIEWDEFGPQVYPGKLYEDIHYSMVCKDCRGRIVQGKFFFEPNPELVGSLEAGVHVLTATFVPDKVFKYHNATAQRDLVVEKRRPIVTWTPPVKELCFLYRQPLDKSLFEGVTTELSGGELSFSHEPGIILEIGIHKLSVEFTPSDADRKNFSRGYATQTIEIAGAAVPLEWNYPFHDRPITPHQGKRAKWEIGAVGKDILFGDPLPNWLFNARCLYEDAVGDWIYEPGPGAIVPSGYNDLRATFKPHDMRRFKTSYISQRVFVHQPHTELTWDTPSPIPEGEVLDEYVLNARCTLPDGLPGTFAYTPDFGALLPQGIHKLHVRFTPDDNNYASSECSVHFKILPKRQLRLMWQEPEDISYPTPLSRYELNAVLVGAGSQSVGEYIYDPPLDTILNAGRHILRVRFEPVKRSIAVAEASVTLTVLPSIARLVWNTPDSLPEGQGLYDTTLNCYAMNVPAGEGTFVYDPPVGTVLSAGKHLLRCTFVPNSDNFIENKISVPLLVRHRPKFMPRLTWPDPVPMSPMIFGTPLSFIQLNAQCKNSLGGFRYTPVEETILPVGEHELTAVFLPLDPSKCIEGITVKSHVTILRRRPHFVWEPTSLDLVYGTVLSTTDHCNATVCFAEGDVSKVDGSFIYDPPVDTLLETGQYRFTCRFTPQDTNNFESIFVEKTLFVTRAYPVISWISPQYPLRQPVSFAHPIFPKPVLRGSTGDANAIVEGHFVYDFDQRELLEVGRQRLQCRFLAHDIINYLSGLAIIEVDVVSMDAPLQVVPQKKEEDITESKEMTIEVGDGAAKEAQGEDN